MLVRITTKRKKIRLGQGNGGQGGLAQLARALDLHSRGHRFDSDILHEKAEEKFIPIRIGNSDILHFSSQKRVTGDDVHEKEEEKIENRIKREEITKSRNKKERSTGRVLF